jgi:LmbE family N-acetylglucosaminyl deacetylase
MRHVPRRRTSRWRWVLRATASTLAFLCVLPVITTPEPPVHPLEISTDERLLVIAPHPDDETLGAGGVLQRVLARGGRARVVVLTAGDGYVEAVQHATGQLVPRPAAYLAYGERRLQELRAAVRRLGAHRIRVQVLGFPDGGLTPLLVAHWQHTQPERSPTTAASHPPYPEVLDADVAYDGADLQRELDHVLHESQPTLVAFPDPLDRHPDHRATGLFTLLALRHWLPQAPATPRLLAYLVHWPNWPPGWDAIPPASQTLETGCTFPPDLPPRDLIRRVLRLTDPESATQRAALALHVSQQAVMPSFLAAFVCRNEPFTEFTTAEVHRVPEVLHQLRQPPSRHPTAGGHP